jgi:uncharacterized membrane protein YoaK (UPF0700 family)
MKLPSLPLVLSFNGGYVDTLGFLALSGLFTAHVTGNFVTLSAAAALGLTGAVSKLLALPVFCLVVFASRLVCQKLHAQNRSPVRPMLAVKLVLLMVAAIIALRYGPIHADENSATLALGMTLVSAMAIQNGLHKAYLSKAPPSTLMTGTTTQIMLDLADLFGGSEKEEVSAAKARIGKMAATVATFAFGCGFAAAAYLAAPVMAFVLPAIVAALALLADTAGAEAK